MGMYFGYRNLASSRADIARLHKLNGQTFAKYQAMRVIAYGHFRNDLFRMSKHVTITTIGVISMVLPQSPGTTNHVTNSGIVITGGLFTISVLLVLASALDRKQREALEEIDETR